MKYENECGSCENSDCRFERECDISPYQNIIVIGIEVIIFQMIVVTIIECFQEIVEAAILPL